MFDVVGKHSIAAKANRHTTIMGLTEGQLWAEVVIGIMEQIRCAGHLQLHGLVHSRAYLQQRCWHCCSSGKPCLAMMGQGFTQLQT